jgi:hypothetical protein
MRYEEIFEFKQEIDFQGQWATIAPEVQQALAIMNSNGCKLYRGISGDKPKSFVSSPREDRKPRDGIPFVQEIVDEWLKNHGFTALRSNSLFVTSDLGESRVYGKPYMIFPVDGFTYTWFRGMKDFSYSLYSNRLGIPVPRLFPGITAGKLSTITLQDFIDRGMTKSDIIACIDKYMEIANPSNSNIEEAMFKGHEIMISCSRYYAVEREYARARIKTLHY